MESMIETEPPLPPLLPVPDGFPEVDEAGPGTNVALGLAMHEAAESAAFVVRAPEFRWAFPPKSHAAALRFCFS